MSIRKYISSKLGQSKKEFVLLQDEDGEERVEEQEVSKDTGQPKNV